MQAQKPRKAHSKCNISRSINHKPTQAQKPRKAHSKCNFPSSVNQIYPCCRSVRSVRIDKPYNISCHENIPTKVPLMRCDLRTVKHTLQNVYPYCRSARSVLIDTCLIRTVTVWVCFYHSPSFISLESSTLVPLATVVGLYFNIWS